MTLPTVVILHGANAAFSVYEITKACAGTCQPVFAFSADDVKANPALSVLISSDLTTQVVPQNATAEEIRTLAAGDSYVTFVDKWVDMIDELRGESTHHRWDKYVQRNVLWHNRLSPKPAIQIDSMVDLDRAWSLYNHKVVLKPRRGVSSRGVRYIDSEKQLTGAKAQLRAGLGLMAEQYVGSAMPNTLHDRLFSVDSISVGGHHYALGVFQKLPFMSVPSRSPEDAVIREVGDVLLALDSSPLIENLIGSTMSALTALDLASGATHTELKVTDGIVEVIEVNGRAGGIVGRMLKIAGGPDLAQLAIQAALEMPVDPPGRLAPMETYGYIDFAFYGEQGRMLRATDRQTLMKFSAVHSVGELQSARGGTASEGRVAEVYFKATSMTDFYQCADEVWSFLCSTAKLADATPRWFDYLESVRSPW